jgi:hypothetical protein
MIPGRWDDVLGPSEIDQAAAESCRLAVVKDPPDCQRDGDADYELGVWPGVIPIRLSALAPVPIRGFLRYQGATVREGIQKAIRVFGLALSLSFVLCAVTHLSNFRSLRKTI